jgi:futalosine hydrolase
MEGASVFKVCEEFDVPCIQIRSISNKVEKRNKKNWDLELAIKNLNIIVEKVIDNL